MAKTATPAAPVAPARDEDLRVALIELAKIKLDPRDTDRIGEDPESLRELAESFKAQGVLQPVGLGVLPAKPGKTPGGTAPIYRIVWGSRRVGAARLAGLTEIPARVKTYAGESELLEARETENFQRRELNPVEEAEAVARLLDLAKEAIAKELGFDRDEAERREGAVDLLELEKRAIARVAARLGKSETWVRDRAFLSKLSGAARQLVLDGRLPLSHAREVTKLADPNLRDQIADQAAGDEEGYAQPMPLPELRQLVARHLYSLAQVPWRVEEAFADAPACSSCPHNSANRPGLFDHHSQYAKNPDDVRRIYADPSGRAEPDAGVCTNRPCFDRKAAATKRAVTTAVKRAAKAVEKGEAKQLTPAAVSAHVPEFVLPGTVRTLAKEKIAAATGKDAKGAKVRSRAPAPAHDWEARNKLQNALRRREDGILQAVTKACVDRPGTLIILTLLAEQKLWSDARTWDEKKARKAAASPGFAALLANLDAPSWEAALTLERDNQEKARGVVGELLRSYGAHSTLLETVAKHFGVEMPPVPKLEDFKEKPKTEPEEKAGRKPEKKKADKKKARTRNDAHKARKKAVRKGGR